jgi:hypothetical protein
MAENQRGRAQNDACSLEGDDKCSVVRVAMNASRPEPPHAAATRRAALAAPALAHDRLAARCFRLR